MIRKKRNNECVCMLCVLTILIFTASVKPEIKPLNAEWKQKVRTNIAGSKRFDLREKNLINLYVVSLMHGNFRFSTLWFVNFSLL